MRVSRGAERRRSSVFADLRDELRELDAAAKAVTVHRQKQDTAERKKSVRDALEARYESRRASAEAQKEAMRRQAMWREQEHDERAEVVRARRLHKHNMRETMGVMQSRVNQHS